MKKTTKYLLEIPDDELDTFLTKHSVSPVIVKDLILSFKELQEESMKHVNADAFVVECPYCHDKYIVGIKDFNYMNDIECIQCHSYYKQELNIKSIVYNVKVD